MGARKWVIGGFLAAAVIIVGLGVYAVRAKAGREQVAADSALANALARAELLGFPVYAEHLRKDPIPDDENAWIEIKRIHDATYGVQRYTPNFSELRDAKEKNQFLEIADGPLGFWKEHFDTARLAAEKPSYRPERRWEEGVALLMPDFSTVKELVRALTMQSRYELFLERFDDSISSLRVAAKLASHIGSEPTEWAVLSKSAIELIIAKEIVIQVGLVDSREHLSRLERVLDNLFEPTVGNDRIVGEFVILVESVRMASSDSETGNELRNSIKPEDRPKLLTFWDATPQETEVFEARAINAACDYYEGLIADFNSSEHNDRLHREFIDLPFALISDGFPLSYASLYEALYSGTFGVGRGPYSGMARGLAYSTIYRLAFENASGDINLGEDMTRVVPGLDNSILEYVETADGYEFTASAPSIGTVTLKFDRL